MKRKTGNAYKTAAKLAAAGALAVALASPAAAAAEHLGYPDLNPGDWYVDSGLVDWSEENGVINGFPDGRWAPNETIQRAQAAAVLFNYSGDPEPAEGATFDDADGLGWAASACAWAQDEGVFNGSHNADGTVTMDPWDPITREQAAAILFNMRGEPAGDASSLDAFPDGGEVSAWAVGAVAWGAERGVLGNGGALNPTDTCTRAEFVAMLKNVVAPDWVPGGDPEPTPDHDGGIVYKDNVVYIGEYKAISASGTYATVSSEAAKDVVPGDIVMFDQTRERPGGAAIKVTSVTESGTVSTISGTKPTLDEIYESFEAHEVAYVDPANFNPAPGVSVVSNTVRPMSDYMGKAITLDLGDIDLGEYGSIKGTATLTPGVIFDAKIFSLNPRLELGVIGDAQLHLDVNVDALPERLRHIKIGDVAVLGVDDWGAVIEFFLNLELDGTVTVTTGINWEASVSTDDGPRAESEPTGTSVDAQVEAEIALEADAAFELCGWSLGRTGIEAGAHGSAAVAHRPNSDLVCNDFSSYFLANFFWDVLEDVNLSFAHLDGEVAIFDEDNSPWKIALHYENGDLVPSCTWNPEADGGHEGPDEPGGGTGTVDPGFGDIPLPDEGWGYKPIWGVSETGRAETIEPFYVDAGSKITISSLEDCHYSFMVGIEGGNSLIRRTCSFEDGETYTYVNQGTVMVPWDSGDYCSYTIEVLVGRMKVWRIQGWGPRYVDSDRTYTEPIVKIEACNSYDYPVQLSANVIELKVGQSYQLSATETVENIYDSLGVPYEGSSRWGIKNGDFDVINYETKGDGSWLISAENPGTTTLTVCYGAEPLSLDGGFKRVCKVTVSE